MPAIVSWLLLVWAAFFAPFVEPLILRAVGAVVAVEAGAALVPEPDPRIGGDLEPTLEDLYPNFLSPAATKLLTAADEALLRRELAAVRDAEADARDGRLGDALRALAARAESSYGREVAALHLGQRAAERGDWEEALRQARRERAALASPDAGRAPDAVRRGRQFALAEEARALLALGRTDEAAALITTIPTDGVGRVGTVTERDSLMKRVSLLDSTRGPEVARQALFSASPPAGDAAAELDYVDSVAIYAMQLGLKGRHADAAAIYRTLLKRYPERVDAMVLYEAAATFDEIGNGEAARELLRATAKRFPDDTQLTYQIRDRADAAASRGDAAGELRWVRQILQVIPADDPARRSWLTRQERLLGEVPPVDLRPTPRTDPLPPAAEEPR